jgi:capsular polysaccharide transport system permease protein
MEAARKRRAPLAVTFAVWRALFLRDVLTRLMQGRFGWFWQLVEPIGHVLIMLALFAVGLRSRTIAGADVVVFLIVGILAFFLVRNVMNRGSAAIGANDELFAFRQIRPLDLVLVRVATEGLHVCVLLLIMLTGAGLLGRPVIPHDPLAALGALGSLFLLGIGLALVLSVVEVLLPELAQALRLMQTPLYLLSGAIYPLGNIPISFREIILWNPIAHGLESLRAAFSPTYHSVPGIEPGYLVESAVVTIFVGLALHARFENQLANR